jgi:hypothetical protein
MIGFGSIQNVKGDPSIMTQAHTQERRRHPRLPLHLSVAKLVDFQVDGLDVTAPAVLVDLSASGLAMICFALPALSQQVTFKLKLPGFVNAQVHGKKRIDAAAAKETLAMLEIDELGLEPHDRRILEVLIDKFHGGPVGLGTLAAAFNELGFSTDLWKDDAIAVHSHPRVIKDIEHTLRHILAGGTLAKRDHDVLARRACRCSIMTGDPLTTKEAEALRLDLLKCLDPLTCPHGRPTVVEMTEGFLDKQFLRT